MYNAHILLANRCLLLCHYVDSWSMDVVHHEYKFHYKDSTWNVVILGFYFQDIVGGQYPMPKKGSKGKPSLLKGTSPHQETLFASQMWVVLPGPLQCASFLFCAGIDPIMPPQITEVYGRVSVNLISPGLLNMYCFEHFS